MKQMEPGIYDFEIQPREVDLTKRATLITLGDHILHTAGLDADRNGFGTRDLHERNIAWVLSRFAIEIDRFPDEYERYKIETWIADVSRVMTTRNFSLVDASGRQIGRASTLWAIIDFETRHPLDLRTNVAYAGRVFSDIPVGMRPPDRLGCVEGPQCEEHRVRYSDIDFNRHTNSMKYIQWMIDMLPLEKMTSGTLRRIDINYVHETRHGESLTILADDTDTKSCFEVRRSDGQSACKAKIEWTTN